MRLFPILCKQHLGRMFKLKWKIKSKRRITDMGIPESLKEMNVKIYDAKELVQPKVVKETVELPEPYNSSPFEIEGKGHPHWNDDPVYEFNRKCRLLEGDKQAMALTKTIGYEGFPPNLLSLMTSVQELNIEELVQDSILEAVIWDGAQRKLPKKVDILRPGWGFPREYGISLRRKERGLLVRLYSLCERIAGKNPTAHSRVKLLDVISKTFMQKGDATLLFDTYSDVLSADSKPLKAHFDQQQVQDTIDGDVPDIYPLKPTIGLTKKNLYTNDEIFPLNFNDRYLHTLYITHNSIAFWFPTQKIGRAIGCCFSFAAAQAHYLYGKEVKDLPSPITVQCICLDPQAFGFVSYQLNTLDIGRKDGIKNQAWIDGPHNLYKEFSEEDGVTDYNHETFLKMLAMYLNGTQ